MGDLEIPLRDDGEPGGVEGLGADLVGVRGEVVGLVRIAPAGLDERLVEHPHEANELGLPGGGGMGEVRPEGGGLHLLEADHVGEGVQERESARDSAHRPAGARDAAGAVAEVPHVVRD